MIPHDSNTKKIVCAYFGYFICTLIVLEKRNYNLRIEFPYNPFKLFPLGALTKPNPLKTKLKDQLPTLNCKYIENICN